MQDLSAGEFVGMVSDDPDCPIQLKAFHNRIINDHKSLKTEHESYKPLPEVGNINNQMIQLCHEEIKRDIDNLVATGF